MAPTPEKPDAFLSYTRFDDRRCRISEFRRLLSEAVEEVSGRSFEIFQDVDDENGIALGKTWQRELDRMLDQSRFFIPVITPKFFASPACRDELSKFLELEEASGRDDLVLPIYWIESELIEEETLRSEDSLAAAIHERQRWDWRDLRHEDFEIAAVQKAFGNLALQIDRIRRNDSRAIVDHLQSITFDGSQVEAKVVRPNLSYSPAYRYWHQFSQPKPHCGGLVPRRFLAFLAG